MRGGAAGLGLRGGPGGIDTTDPTPEYRFFRANFSGSNTTGRIYPAGYRGSGGTGNGIQASTVAALQATAAAPGDTLYAIPEPFPRGGRITRIAQLVYGVTTADNANLIRFGIYNDSGTGNPYPKDLIYDSGALKAGTVDAYSQPQLNPSGVSAPPGSYLWFVFQMTPECAANGLQLHVADECCMETPLGMVSDFTSQVGSTTQTPSMGIGWRHARAFGALPATFPTSSPAALVARNVAGTFTIPVIYFGFTTP